MTDLFTQAVVFRLVDEPGYLPGSWEENSYAKFFFKVQQKKERYQSLKRFTKEKKNFGINIEFSKGSTL